MAVKVSVIIPAYRCAATLRQAIDSALFQEVPLEILVLDDSASALDFATDAALRRAIADLDQEMTVLIVSQRANTVRYADQIVVLDDGKAVGIGTHEQLLESCEEYQEIYWSQNERVLAKEEA